MYWLFRIYCFGKFVIQIVGYGATLKCFIVLLFCNGFKNCFKIDKKISLGLELGLQCIEYICVCILCFYWVKIHLVKLSLTLYKCFKLNSLASLDWQFRVYACNQVFLLLALLFFSCCFICISEYIKSEVLGFNYLDTSERITLFLNTKILSPSCPALQYIILMGGHLCVGLKRV